MSFTVDPQLKSFIPVQSDSDFPIQNLPYGIFQPRNKTSAHVGVAIGEMILDLSLLEQKKLIDIPTDKPLFDQPSLNKLMGSGRTVWTSIRRQLVELLQEGNSVLRDDTVLRNEVFIPMSDVEMVLPVDIPDYTDFYSSRYHANNVGTMIRGAENALQENWLHLPVAYHGRASSVIVSGTDIYRPTGQTGAGTFGASKAIDFELEMGFFIGPGSELGESISIDESMEHIFGMVLVNDWSARDIQRWEYVPLGPFLAKSFATSISPWIVTLDALEPFRVEPETQTPQPQKYLQWDADHSFDIHLEAELTPANGEESTRITSSNFRHLYWTIAQQLAHHSVAGCNMRTGDLLASGTISGPEKTARGCLLEITWKGTEPITLSNGEERTYLENHDQIRLSGWCQGEGYRVGFGEVTGTLLPTKN